MGLLPAALGAQQVQTGAYVARQGETEVTRETFRFDGRVLSAQVEVVGRGLFLETETVYDSSGGTARYHLYVRPGLGGPALQELQATVGDSLRWTLTAGGRPRNGSAAIGRPAMIVQNLVFSQLAAALRAYDRRSGGRQLIHAWLPDGGTVLPLAVELRGDSGTLELGGVSIGMTLETNAMKYFSQAARDATDQEVRAFYLFLADWEKLHYDALQNLFNAVRADQMAESRFAPF